MLCLICIPSAKALMPVLQLLHIVFSTTTTTNTSYCVLISGGRNINLNCPVKFVAQTHPDYSAG